jgi:hypothetical protein
MSGGGRGSLILPFWLLVFGVFRFAFDHRRVRPKGVQERLARFGKAGLPVARTVGLSRDDQPIDSLIWINLPHHQPILWHTSV